MPTTIKRAETKKPRAPARRTAPPDDSFTEDEADFIISITERGTGRTIPLEKAMERLGYLRLTEDEADFIISERTLRKEGHKAIPLEEVLKEYGRQPRRRVAS